MLIIIIGLNIGVHIHLANVLKTSELASYLWRVLMLSLNTSRKRQAIYMEGWCLLKGRDVLHERGSKPNHLF